MCCGSMGRGVVDEEKLASTLTVGDGVSYSEYRQSAIAVDDCLASDVLPWVRIKLRSKRMIVEKVRKEWRSM